MNDRQYVEVRFWRELAEEKGDKFIEFRLGEDCKFKTENLPSFKEQRGLGLDLGSGLVSVLENTGKDFVAIDPLMDEYDRIIPLKNRPVKYVQQDNQDEISFPDNHFDWVFFVNVLDHTPDPQKLVNEIFRVLKPGGTLYFEVNFDQIHSPAHYDHWNVEMVNQALKEFEQKFVKVVMNPNERQELFWAEYKKPEVVKNPRFSILMPTMGTRMEFLQKAIQSVLAQTFKDFEIIVKDGGETDMSSQLPKDPRIRYLRKPDKGIADANNQAMEIARGEIFNEANDDDIMLPNTLEIIDREIGDALWIYSKILVNGQPVGHAWDYEALKQANFVPQPAAFWKREAWLEVGGWDSENDLAADYEYWLRLGRVFIPKVLNDILADYTIHPGQITSHSINKQNLHASNVRQKYADIRTK